MSDRSALTISLTPELKALIARRPGSWRCTNACEVVRAALHLMERHEADLRSSRRKTSGGMAAVR